MPQLSEEKQRILGRRLDDHVLSYLRKMVRICRYKKHRELRWTYEEAWDFATNIIYGELPPRPQYNLRGTGIIPPPEPKPLTGYQVQMRQRPMRKVVSAMALDGEFHLVLECHHHLREFICDPDAPMPQRRRCQQCIDEVAKKQPSSAKLNSKAVSA